MVSLPATLGLSLLFTGIAQVQKKTSLTAFCGHLVDLHDSSALSVKDKGLLQCRQGSAVYLFKYMRQTTIVLLHDGSHCPKRAN